VADVDVISTCLVLTGAADAEAVRLKRWLRRRCGDCSLPRLTVPTAPSGKTNGTRPETWRTTGLSTSFVTRRANRPQSCPAVDSVWIRGCNALAPCVTAPARQSDSPAPSSGIGSAAASFRRMRCKAEGRTGAMCPPRGARARTRETTLPGAA
jgi:hypothetical protein